MLNPWGDDATDIPQLLAPPIRFLYETDDLLAHVGKDRDRLLAALHRKLEPDGIDLWELDSHFEYWGVVDEEERTQQRQVTRAVGSGRPRAANTTRVASDRSSFRRVHYL